MANPGDDDDDDLDDAELRKAELDAVSLKEELEVLEECVIMLNEPSRVQNLLLAVEETQEPLVLQALCQVCHNLLMSNKLAVHKYR